MTNKAKTPSEAEAEFRAKQLPLDLEQQEMNAERRRAILQRIEELKVISAAVETWIEEERDADARSFLESTEGSLDEAIAYLISASK